MQVQVIAKENGSNSLIKNYLHKIKLTDSSIVLIDVKVEDIEKIEYLNNQAVITLKNGEKIAVDNFNIEESSLVFRNEQAELFLFDFKTVTYNPIDKIEPLLYGQSESSFVSVWPFVGLALGGIGLIAGAAGGSGGGGSSEAVTKVKKPQDVIIGNGDSFINKEEVQDDKVEVTIDLPTGLTDQDKVIVNGEEHALTQEDVEAGKIVVNVPLEGKTEGKFDVTVEIKDKAGNVSDSVTESAIIDLTPPIVDDVILKIDRIAQDGVINIEESNDKVIVIGQLTSIPKDSIATKIQVTVGEETVDAIIFDFKNGIWSAQLQGASFGNVAGEVNATVTFKDQAGNTSTKSTASNYEVDLSKPEVKSIEPADKVLAKDEVVTITITFNEEIKGLELSDFEAKGGLISGLQQFADDKTVWTLSFKQAGTDQPSLKLKEGSYTDLAGNPGSEKVLDKANGGFESDITPPALGDVIFNIVSIATDGIVNAVESASLNVPIVGKLSSIPSDSTLTAIKVTVGDQVVEAQIVNLETGEWTANIEGKHFLNNTQVLAEATFKDAAGNTSAKTTVENYTVDTTVPKVESITASDTLLAKGEKVIITVKFSEEVKGLDINDFVPVGGSVNNLQQSATDKTVWTLEFVQEGADQPSLILKEGSYTDLAGNPGSEKVLDKANGGFESDITPPALDGVIFTIETVAEDGIVNIAESQDKVTIVGQLTSIPADSIETVIQVTVGSETVDATITDAQSGTWAAVLSGSSFGDVAGEVVAEVTFKDKAGNESNKTANAPYAIDLKAPKYTNSYINEDGKIVLEFDELLDNDNPPTFDSFVIIKNTDEVVEIQGVEIVDQQVVITTVKPIYQSDKVQVSYVDKDLKDKNAIQDDAGNGSSEFNTGILSNDSLLSGLVSDFNNISGVPTSVNQDTLVASGRDFLNLFNVMNSTQNEIKAGTVFNFEADEYAGNHSVKVSLDTSSLLSVAKAYGVVLQQKNVETGEWVNLISAPMGQNGVVASLGTQYALGAIDNNSASVTFSGLEPGQYRIATYADQSELKKLISDIELANLGQGGYLLGKDNQDALIKELKLILGKDSVAGATLIDYLTTILNTVNLITFPISALVDKVIGTSLLKPLVSALDEAIDIVVGNLVNNLVSVLQETTVTVSPSTSFYKVVGNVIKNDALDNIVVKEVEVTTDKSSSNEDSEPVVTEVNGSTVINGKYGKLIIQPNGEYEYTVSPEFANSGLIETFKYTVNNVGSETLTINLSKATQELLAIDNNVDLNLNVAPSEKFMTKDELQEHYSKTTVNVAYIGLGSVLDLGALTPKNSLQFKVDPLTEQVITFNGKSGGVQVLTNYNLYVYKLNEKTNKLELVELKENWFGVALLGGASKQPVTYTFDEGQYYAVLEPTSGVNALYGYTLEATQNKVLNYANPISVSGIAKGNLINDIDLQAKGQDVGPNIESSFITQVIDAKGVVVSVKTDQITDAVTVQGKYGQLTISADGTYSYEAFNSKNFNYGDVEEFTYTIYDPISGQSDNAQLKITLDFSNTENGLSTVVALLEIEPTVKTLVEKVELEDVNLNTITKGKINATAFSVAEISLGDVVDAGIISADNSINISVKSGELANIKFHASAYQAVSVASIFDLQVYKKLDNGQLELFYTKPNYVVLPVTLVIPLGGIHIGDPINLDFPEGEYVALLNSTAGIGAIGGTTLEVKEISVEDYNNPVVYKGEVSGKLDIPVDGKIYTLNGKKVESLESTVVKGTYGTLTYHADGTYEYFVDATYQIPQFGMIDTFSYSYKEANGEVVSSILNVKLSTVDANQDKQFDSEKKEIDIAAPMVNKVEQVIIDEKTGLRLPIWDEIKDKESKVIEIVNTPYMTTDLTFSLNVDLDIKGLYKTGLHFELYKIVKNAQTGEVTYSKVGDTISLKDVQKDTLSHTWENLKSGTYTVKYSIDGHNGTGMDYGFNFSQTYNYHDSWTSTGKDADYLAGQVIGNFLSNDKFALGLKDQAIVKFGNKYLYLGSNEVQEITVYGSYGDLVVKSDGSYVFTPNGLGGGREYFDYEIISPTGESDKAAVEFSVAKVIQGNEFNNLVESSASNDIYTLSSGSDTVIFDVLDLSHDNGGNGIDTWTDFHLTTSLTDENADKIDVSSLLVGYEQGDDLKEFVSIGKTADGKAIVQIDRDGKADEFQKTDLLVLENQTVATQQAQLDLLNQLIANQQLIG
ncbi:Ig-like domain-containing protein [Acinetobacter schindleri]|uniref:BapA/Bap/LapF family large adhesin n=3 Tax=Acinetobacter schindleri TaxID=108981 RepID=UPI003A85ACAC